MQFLQSPYPIAGSSATTVENHALVAKEVLNKKKVTFADQQNPRCMIYSSDDNTLHMSFQADKKFDIKIFEPSDETYLLQLDDKTKNESHFNSTVNTDNSITNESKSPKKYNYHKDIINVINIKSRLANITIGKNTETDHEVIIEAYKKPTVIYNELFLTEDFNNITVLLPDKFNNKEIFIASKHGSISTDPEYILQTPGKIKTYDSNIKVQIDNAYIHPHCRMKHGTSKIRGRIINSIETKKLLLDTKKGDIFLDVFSLRKMDLATFEVTKELYI